MSPISEEGYVRAVHASRDRARRRRRHALPRPSRQAQRAAPAALARHPRGRRHPRSRPGRARDRAGGQGQGVLRRYRPGRSRTGARAGGSLSGIEGSPVAKRRQLYDDIRAYQRTASCFADTNKPVIAAVHGACLGAGMDLITACDLRLASADAIFSVRETRIAMVADIGSLQRLPRCRRRRRARMDLHRRRLRRDAGPAVQLFNAVLPDPKPSCTRAALAAAIAGQFSARRAGRQAGARFRHRDAKSTRTWITSRSGTRPSCIPRILARPCRPSWSGGRRSSAGSDRVSSV